MKGCILRTFHGRQRVTYFTKYGLTSRHTTAKVQITINKILCSADTKHGAL